MTALDLATRILTDTEALREAAEPAIKTATARLRGVGHIPIGPLYDRRLRCHVPTGVEHSGHRVPLDGDGLERLRALLEMAERLASEPVVEPKKKPARKVVDVAEADAGAMEG